jgi:hypothetical protein
LVRGVAAFAFSIGPLVDWREQLSTVLEAANAREGPIVLANDGAKSITFGARQWIEYFGEEGNGASVGQFRQEAREID